MSIEIGKDQSCRLQRTCLQAIWNRGTKCCSLFWRGKKLHIWLRMVKWVVRFTCWYSRKWSATVAWFNECDIDAYAEGTLLQLTLTLQKHSFHLVWGNRSAGRKHGQFDRTLIYFSHMRSSLKVLELARQTCWPDFNPGSQLWEPNAYATKPLWSTEPFSFSRTRLWFDAKFFPWYKHGSWFWAQDQTVSYIKEVRPAIFSIKYSCCIPRR